MEDIGVCFEVREFGIDGVKDVGNEGWGDGVVEGGDVWVRDGVGEEVGGGGVVLKEEEGVMRGGRVRGEWERVGGNEGSEG